ncbi:serine/threonine kinase [Aureococcus anophagefferens]|nr:serine/threonine kinase [Aureococcus anophagefferens]
MVVDVAPVTRAYDFPGRRAPTTAPWASGRRREPQPGANLPTQAASRLEAEGAVDAWAYDFVVAWYPDICWGWAGVAYLPGTDAAVSGFGDLDWDLLVGMHEQGHNFGLGHASTYGSPYDPMGNGMAWGLGDAFTVSGRLLMDWAPADRVPVANPALCGDAGCAFALARRRRVRPRRRPPVGVRVATDVADTYFFVEYRAARAACVVSVGEVVVGRSWMPNTILTDAALDDAPAWHLLEAGATVVVDAAAAGADAKPVSVALALVGGAPVVTGCGAQGANLGTTFADANECALAARDVSACGNYVMWSVEYNAHWGCRCCAPGGELGGGANDLWDVFAYDCDPDDDGGAPPAPAPTGKPAPAPTAKPAPAPTAKPVASSPTAKPVSSPTAAEPPKDVFLYSNKNMRVYFLRWRAGAAAQPFSIQYQVKGTEDWIDDGVRVVEPEYDGTFYDILAPQHVPATPRPRYELIKPIGKGKFAVVYRARRIADDELVALKKIAVDSMDHRGKVPEVRLLQSLHHPNIIRYLDSLIEGDELVIVFEWAAAGDLKRQIRKAVERKQGFEERVIWKYFSQICDALAHMHEQRILHRDLKPANVFLTLNGTVKVGDLGLGRMMSEHTFEAHSKVGTPLYMSPEVLRGDGYDWKSDVWSLGCVLYELAMLRSPFKAEGLNLYSLFQKISKADYEPLPDTYSAPLRDLATAMPPWTPDVAYACDVATRMRKETMSAAAAARAEAQRAAPSEAKGEDRGDDAKTTAVVAPAAFATKRPQAAPEDARRDVLEAPRAPPKRDPAVGAREVGIGIALQQNAQNWRQKNALAAKDDDDDGFEVDSLLTDSVS